MLARGVIPQIQTCFRCLTQSLHPACFQILIPATGCEEAAAVMSGAGAQLVVEKGKRP